MKHPDAAAVAADILTSAGLSPQDTARALTAAQAADVDPSRVEGLAAELMPFVLSRVAGAPPEEVFGAAGVVCYAAAALIVNMGGTPEWEDQARRFYIGLADAAFTAALAAKKEQDNGAQ